MKIFRYAWRVLLIAFCLLLVALAIHVVALSVRSNASDRNLATALTGSSQFIDEMSKLTGAPVGYGGEVETIEGGDKFEPILIGALDSASTSIDFTTYPWSNGTFSQQVFAAFSRAVKRGVNVHVLFDALGSHTMPRGLVENLKASGVKVAVYHQLDILDPLSFDSRDHMRIMVVDGDIGFTGGMGIGGQWFGGDPKNFWQDMMFEMKGSMAQSLEDSFVQIWKQTTGEALSKMTKDARQTNEQIADNQNAFVGITSIPHGSDQPIQPIRAAFTLTAMSAQKKLYIVSPFIVPDQQFLNILEGKARAGVDVRIVSPGPNTQGPFLRYAWHADYRELLAAGVKIYEYQPLMIHTKFMVADDSWSLIGSANLDNRSEAINAENVMGISDPVLASSLDNVFADYISKSEEITAADWNKRFGFFSNLFSRALLIFDKEY